MVCKNCGKKLKRNDNFCSQCGTPVAEDAIKKTSPDDVMKTSGMDNEEIRVDSEKPLEFEVLKEKFEWNVHTFPGHAPKKTEDVDFDWKIEEEEFKARPQGDPEIAFSPIPPAERWSAIEAENEKRRAEEANAAAEEKAKKMAELIKKREEERRLDAEIEQKAKMAADEREASEKREKEVAEAAEEKKAFAEAIRKAQEEKAAVEKAMEEKIAQEAAEKERILAAEKAKAALEEKVSCMTDEPGCEDSQPTADFAQDESPEKQGEKIKNFDVVETTSAEEKTDTDEETEKELFGGAAVAGFEDEGEGLSRHTAKIDKFYTINQKNEEFQKLLDREYEKVKGGKPLDEDVFAADVQKIQHDVEAQKKTQVFPPINQVEEMARARRELLGKTSELKQPLFGNSSETERRDALDESENQKVDGIFSDLPKETVKIPVPDRPFDDFLKSDNKSVEHSGAEEIKIAEESNNGNLEKEETSDKKNKEEKEKRGCLSKIIILILLIILFVLLGALAMKYFAPLHPVTEKIDEITGRILNLFMLMTKLI